MKIRVLGSGSGMPVPDRNCSAYLVEADSQVYLIDAGEGVARQLVSCQINPEQITHVFISHVHPDHLSGLFMLLQWMHMTHRQRSLQIYLPQGVLPGFQTVLSYFHIFQEKWPFRFQFQSIVEGVVFRRDGFQLSAVPNGHLSGNKKIADHVGVGSDSYSFILSEKNHGKVIYTSDVDSLAHLNIDNHDTAVLISECAHLDVEAIVDFACAADIPRVILTHIPPAMDRSAFPGERDLKSPIVERAYDGQVIEV